MGIGSLTVHHGIHTGGIDIVAAGSGARHAGRGRARLGPPLRGPVGGRDPRGAAVVLLRWTGDGVDLHVGHLVHAHPQAAGQVSVEETAAPRDPARRRHHHHLPAHGPLA